MVGSRAEERRRPEEAAAAFVSRAAREKAEEVSRRYPGRWILAADTIVVIDGGVLGKPIDEADARRMLASLSGRTHEVVTAFVLLDPAGRPFAERRISSRVTFRELRPGEIDEYVASDEPFDKAGAYAVQGRAGGFVRRLEGSFANVVGLPLDEVRESLAAAGLWQDRERAPG